jgi:hypothetical protein
MSSSNISSMFSTTVSALTLLTKFKDEILKITKITKEELNFFFDKNLSKYLDNQFDKFYTTKTFHFRDNKVNFYETFFPVTLKVEENLLDTSRVSSLYFEKSNYITVIGIAGSGKTMLMKHFFLNSYSELFRIPVVIELRHLNEYDGDVIKYFYSVLLEYKVVPSSRILERILESGKFLFLLDGYDEIYSDHKKKITEQIEGFVDKYSNNYFVLTSRPGADAEHLSRFENYYVQELSDTQIIDFVRQQLLLADDSRLGDKIIQVIKKPENEDYKNNLRNPLLLSMFLLTFRQYPDLPRSRSKFYWNVFDTLATKHDSLSKKGGFQHERKSGLQIEDFEIILRWLAYITLFKGKYSFDRQFFSETLQEIKRKLYYNYEIESLISDLTVSISIIIIDGLEYKFPHKSFQEYFCAGLIKSLDVQSKKKVYETKFGEYFNKTNSESNLWELCLDSDKISFLELWVLPILENNVAKLKKDPSVVNFRALTGYAPILIIYDSQSMPFDFTFSYTVTLFTRCISFLKMHIFNSIFDDHIATEYLKINGVDALMTKEYVTMSDFIFGGNTFDINVIDLAKDGFELSSKLEIPRKVHIFIELIEQKIKGLKIDLENERKQTISLLDIEP